MLKRDLQPEGDNTMIDTNKFSNEKKKDFC